MPTRLVAIDEGVDIPLDREMVVVGRHPQCDARLDSLRVSRHHCCMTNNRGEVLVRDLGSTNGIRINGQRVEFGRLKAGDELSIAHIRYRLEDGMGYEATMADNARSHAHAHASPGSPRLSFDEAPDAPGPFVMAGSPSDSKALAAAFRDMLPAGLADRCLIQVIVQKPGEVVAAVPIPAMVENPEPCRPDSSP